MLRDPRDEALPPVGLGRARGPRDRRAAPASTRGERGRPRALPARRGRAPRRWPARRCRGAGCPLADAADRPAVAAAAHALLRGARGAGGAREARRARARPGRGRAGARPGRRAAARVAPARSPCRRCATRRGPRTRLRLPGGGSTPSLARLGAPVLYRGRRGGAAADRPALASRRLRGARSSGASRARAGSRSSRAAGDARPSASCPPRWRWRSRSRCSRIGYVSVPGPRLPGARAGTAPGAAAGCRWCGWAWSRCVPPQDTSARLRPLRGPLGAPWWERRVVADRRRRGARAGGGRSCWCGACRGAGPPRRRCAAAPRRARAPDAVALEALAALRARRLPEAGRFAEHALELTRDPAALPRGDAGRRRGPGDSTPELLARLEAAALAPADARARWAGCSRRGTGSSSRAPPATPTRRTGPRTAVEGWVRRRARPGAGGPA